MKDALIFLGSVASAPFQLRTMKKFVNYFEGRLNNEVGTDPSDETKRNLSLYRDIKNKLAKVHCYADLESVFSVLDVITRNIE